MTDHQALKTIYGPTPKPSARIERWVLRLQPFNYKVRFVTSRENIADALPRLTKIPASKGYVQDEEYVREVTLHLESVALRIEEIEVSFQGEQLEAVREALKIGHWSKAPKAYELVSHELACIGQVVLRGTGIVVPSRRLRTRGLDLAHDGYQCEVKTKECLRSKVWWPGIDKEAEKKCRECFGCQMVSKHVPPPPIKPTRLPERA